MSITVDVNLFISALKVQRNDALDREAALSARNAALQGQVDELKQKLEAKPKADSAS